MRLLRVFLATCLAAALAATPIALGRRGASHAEKRAITAAVKRSRHTSEVPDHRYDVKRIRISTAARGWARAEIVPKPRYRDSAQGATALLRKASGRWKVRNLGHDGLGCRIPKAVAADLRLEC